jgi:hypothetical protein
MVLFIYQSWNKIRLLTRWVHSAFSWSTQLRLFCRLGANYRCCCEVLKHEYAGASALEQVMNWS